MDDFRVAHLEYPLMPITVYADGSGTNPDSQILTLAICAMEDGLLASFTDRWKEAIQLHGLQELHMRKLGDIEDPERVNRLMCDVLNVLGHFREQFFYFRVCSVWRPDHAEAQQTMPLLRSPELLCVDFCLGGLAVPAADLERQGAVKIFWL
jgi:hypothetical protein